jgi:WD40 repeat protein
VAVGDETRVTLPGQVEVINLETGLSLLKEKFPEQLRYASCVLFSPDGKFVISGSNDTKGYVYDISNEKAIGFFGGHKRPINGMVLIPDSKMVVSVSGGRTKGKNELKVWDFESGDELASFEPHTEIINCVALSPDKQLLATGGQDKTAIIWEMETIYKENQKQIARNERSGEETSKRRPPQPSLPE